VDTGDAKVAVVGLGRLGIAVYKQLVPEYGDVLIGLDSNPKIVNAQQAAGRNVVLADATDDELWEGVAVQKVEVGILALKNHQENMAIIRRVKLRNRNAKLFAVANHEDEVEELIAAGAESAWNIYSTAGGGLASDVIAHFSQKS